MLLAPPRERRRQLTQEQSSAIILDNGSGTIKAGFCGANSPRAYFPSVVGRNKTATANHKYDYVGDNAVSHKEQLALKYPIQHGIVQDWDAMEQIWHHMFYDEIRICPEEHPVMLTEPPLNPDKNRKNSMQILFETFAVPYLTVVLQPVLTMYASGRTYATIVDSGDGVTHVTPFYDGHILKHGIQRWDFAGSDLTDYLMKLITQRGYSMHTSGEREVVKGIKESLCYVADDLDQELRRAQESTAIDAKYELPDGTEITIGSERFMVGEALFSPHLVGVEAQGIHHMVASCIAQCDIDTRRDLYANVVLSGATSLMQNFSERLTNEVRGLIPTTAPLRVVAPPERRFSVWIGGSIITAMSDIPQDWISSSDYSEHGLNAALRKLSL